MPPVYFIFFCKNNLKGAVGLCRKIAVFSGTMIMAFSIRRPGLNIETTFS